MVCSNCHFGPFDTPATAVGVGESPRLPVVLTVPCCPRPSGIPRRYGIGHKAPGHLASDVLSGSVELVHWPVFVVSADGSGEYFASRNVVVSQLTALELSNSVKEFGNFRSSYAGLRLFGEL